jgi:hypothetical protein
VNDDMVKMGGSAAAGAGLLAAALRLFPQLLQFWDRREDRQDARGARTEDRLWKRIDDDREDCDRRLAHLQSRIDAQGTDLTRLVAAYERWTGQTFHRSEPVTDP